MKKIILITFFALVLINAVYSQELRRVHLFNTKVSILIPKEFDYMSEEMMKLKYPSERRPPLVFTNAKASINLAFNHTKDEMTAENLEEFGKVFEQLYKNMYPSAKWIDVGIKNINGKKFGFQELITPAMDTKIYNLMLFTDLNGRLFYCTFNCTISEKDQWEETATRGMKGEG